MTSLKGASILRERTLVLHLQDKRESHMGMGSVFLLAAVLSGFMAFPLFVHLLLPYPPLSAFHHWRGIVVVEGGYGPSRSGFTTPRTFIQTNGGNFEFACGPLGARTGCVDDTNMDGAEGEVWYHPAVGAAQWHLVVGGDAKRPRLDRAYETSRAEHERRFDKRRYYLGAAATIVFTGLMIWQFVCYGRVGSQMRRIRSGATGSKSTHP
jgi:hypothetical protein